MIVARAQPGITLQRHPRSKIADCERESESEVKAQGRLVACMGLRSAEGGAGHGVEVGRPFAGKMVLLQVGIAAQHHPTAALQVFIQHVAHHNLVLHDTHTQTRVTPLFSKIASAAGEQGVAQK